MRIWGFLNKRPYQWMLYLFIAALFADAANIPDIFVDQTVIVDHDDEDPGILSLLSQQISSLPFTNHTQTVVDSPNVKKAPRVIYDVDSPSLQAGVTHPFVSIRTISNESVVHLLSPFLLEDLYLRNSSLLI
jgi:hypothetical protein